jgi:hypothetical protein
MQDHDDPIPSTSKRSAWNKGKLIDGATEEDRAARQVRNDGADSAGDR